MGKHSMTDRNLFGQERPGEGQISVADAEWNAKCAWIGPPVTCVVYPPSDDWEGQ